MTDGVTYLWLVLGIGFVLITGARLGAGGHTTLAGLFPPMAVRDWPHGVQEPDAPRFAVDHLDALRGGAILVPPGTARSAEPGDPVEPAEIIELYDRPWTSS